MIQYDFIDDDDNDDIRLL